MPIRCLIVDDEAPARDELRSLLLERDGVEIVGEAATAKDAIEQCGRLAPDVAFLDIQMPGQDGFDVIRGLEAEGEPQPLFIFVTAYDDHALKAFDSSALDYLLKPVAPTRLAAALDKAERLLAARDTDLRHDLEALLATVKPAPEVRSRNRICVEKKGRFHLLDPRAIAFFAADDHHILAHTREGVLPVHGIASMDRLEEHLEGTSFFRVHRSTLVNLDAIREFSPWFNGKYSLVMADADNSQVTVSRHRVKDFKRSLGF